MMLNVVGFLAFFWLGRERLNKPVPLRLSKADGGCDMYIEEIDPPAGLSVPLDQGLWKGGTAPLSAWNLVLSAPLAGEDGSGIAERSIRFSGQGMPEAESSGSEGEARI